MRLPIRLLTPFLSAAFVQAQVEPPPADAPIDFEKMEVRKAVLVEETPSIPYTTPVPVIPAAGRIVFTRCEVPQKAIALTFDDGPHPEFTPRLLDTLKRENIKATFFMVGRCVVTYPSIVKRMVAEGHEVASHSWSHPLLTSLKQPSVDSQMQRTHDAIIKVCGVTPTLYRPPYGEIRMSQRKRLNEQYGYLTILWDVDPLDWKTPRSSQKVHDQILRQTRAGSIILAHDIHATTVDAMPSTIASLKAKGFQFQTVTQLIELENQARIAASLPTPEAEPTAPETSLPVSPAELAPAQIEVTTPLPSELPGETR